MLHLRLTWKSLVVAFACCAFARASGAEVAREATLRLDQLPEQVRVVEQADTLDALIARLKPTLVFSRRDMLWADVDEDGLTVFTLARAHRLELAGRKPAWVVLEYRPGAIGPVEIFTDYLRNTIRLKPEIPVRDGGPGQYAVIFSRRAEGGTVYQIGWETGPAGSGNWITGRRLFVFRDRDGWRFIGEGPGELSGRGSLQGVRFRPRWTDDFQAPVEIQYTICRWWTPTGEVEWILPPLTICTDGVLGGHPAMTRETAADYFVVRKGDTFQSIVSRIAFWSDTHSYLSDPAARRRSETLVHQRLRELNPRERFDALKEHSRLRVPDPDHIRRDAQALRATPRAAPSTRPATHP